jgi:hypothetical protein
VEAIATLLVAFIVELIAPFLISVIALLFDLVFTIIAFVSTGTIRWQVRKARLGEDQDEAKPQKRIDPRILRWVTISSFSLLALSVVVMVVINLFFFEGVLRYTLAKAEDKSAIKIDFEKASGNLFTGKVEMEGVKIQRVSHPVSTFDLAMREVSLDLSVWGLLKSEKSIESVQISGVRGNFTKHTSPKESTKTRFEVHSLVVKEVDLTVVDHSREGSSVMIALTVDSLESRPFRKSTYLFDILFRTNARGSLDGEPFSITTAEVEGGRETKWNVSNLPVSSVSPYVGGVLAWIEYGKIDVDVVDTWSLSKSPDIEMHWKFVLRDFRARVPPEDSLVKKTFGLPITTYLNRHSEKLPLEFDLVLNKDLFTGQASLEAVGLWKAVSFAFLEMLSGKAGVPSEAIKAYAKKGVGGFKNFLEKRRKARSEK